MFHDSSSPTPAAKMIGAVSRGLSSTFKAVTRKIMNLSFSGKQRLLRGLLDGPIVIGSSTLIPHHELENEDALEEILKHTTMTVRHNQPLLLELLTDKHTTKSL